IHLVSGTIRDNITLGDETITDEDVRRVASVAGLDEYIRSLPAGYDTLLGPGGTKLSHGQEQLLSLARALVCNPALLLLDEPTSGLDADTERRLFAAIREESKKRTTITISHRMSGVMDAERVIVMAGGQIVQDGTPEQLAEEDGWYAMMRALETLGWVEATS
ncbi:MAG: ATP-binding cassette domain-containing protein, partial [Chloroflexota bacterium]